MEREQGKLNQRMSVMERRMDKEYLTKEEFRGEITSQLEPKITALENETIAIRGQVKDLNVTVDRLTGMQGGIECKTYVGFAKLEERTGLKPPEDNDDFHELMNTLLNTEGFPWNDSLFIAHQRQWTSSQNYYSSGTIVWGNTTERKRFLEAKSFFERKGMRIAPDYQDSRCFPLWSMIEHLRHAAEFKQMFASNYNRAVQNLQDLLGNREWYDGEGSYHWDDQWVCNIRQRFMTQLEEAARRDGKWLHLESPNQGETGEGREEDAVIRREFRETGKGAGKGETKSSGGRKGGQAPPERRICRFHARGGCTNEKLSVCA